MSDEELMEDLLHAWESCKADQLVLAMRAIRERLEKPKHREWKELTKGEIKVLWGASNNYGQFAELLQSKLREKNEKPSKS